MKHEHLLERTFRRRISVWCGRGAAIRSVPPWGHRLLVACCVIIGATVAGFQGQGANRDRLVPNRGDGHPFVVESFDGGVNAVYAERLLLSIASSVRLPMGLDRIGGEETPDWPRETPQATVLTGLTVGNAVNRVLEAGRYGPAGTSFPRPGAAWVNDVLDVSLVAARSTFLDTTVASFHVENCDIREAINDVHRLLDPSYPPESAIGEAGSESSDGPRLRQLLHAQRVTLSLEHATVRQILNAIVTANGDAMWVVHFKDGRGAYAGCEILVQSFEGLGILTTARSGLPGDAQAGGPRVR